MKYSILDNMTDLLSSQSCKTLSRYEIASMIGRGAGSCVYKIRCLKTGKYAALKVIEKKPQGLDKLQKRIYNEIELHLSTKHQNIIKLYNHFEDNENFYIVLELCVRGDLHTYLRSTGPLPESQIRELGLQLAKGLHYLHSNKIIHRDLKLCNVLLTEDDVVKICDFGLAVKLRMAGEEHDTICGTPNYISPEMVNKTSYNEKSDCWAFGCILYAMATGSPPFEGRSIKETLMKVQKGEFQFPKHITPELRDLLENLIQHDPVLRFDMDQVLQHPFFTQKSLKPKKVTPIFIENQEKPESKLGINHIIPPFKIFEDPDIQITSNSQPKKKEPLAVSNRPAKKNSAQFFQFDKENIHPNIQLNDEPLMSDPNTLTKKNNKLSLLEEAQLYQTPPTQHFKKQNIVPLVLSPLAPMRLNNYYLQSGFKSTAEEKQNAFLGGDYNTITTPSTNKPLSNELNPMYLRETGKEKPTNRHKVSDSKNNLSRLINPQIDLPNYYLDTTTISSSRTHRSTNSFRNMSTTSTEFESTFNYTICQTEEDSLLTHRLENFTENQKKKESPSSIISKLSTHGLQPMVLNTAHTKVQIYNDGWLSLEILKHKRVLRVSPDGNEVRWIRIISNQQKIFDVDDLPKKYANFYNYAKRVCDTIRAKTTKATLKDEDGIFTLVESTPFPIVEGKFTDGVKVKHVISSETMRITTLDRNTYEIDIHQDTERVSRDLQIVIAKTNEKVKKLIEKCENY